LQSFSKLIGSRAELRDASALARYVYPMTVSAFLTRD